MKKVSILAVLILAVGAVAVAFAYPANSYFDTLYDHSPSPGILDGTPKTFIVTGYSTSLYPDAENNWPAVLQRMLDEHAGGQRQYYMYNRAKGSTPIAYWADICAKDNSLIDSIVHDFVDPGVHPDIQKGSTPKATVMLGQQSLQYVFDCTDRFMEIEVGYGETPGSADQTRIEQGAAAVEYFSNQFLDGGFERVYLATHIYAPFHEYELYGERFALARALDEVPGLYPGPEVWEVTKSLWPDGFSGDQRHPEKEVTHAMALYWYIVLAGEDAKPDVMEPVAEIAGVPIPSADGSAVVRAFRHYMPLVPGN